jgi:hypothetical protein
MTNLWLVVAGDHRQAVVAVVAVVDDGEGVSAIGRQLDRVVHAVKLDVVMAVISAATSPLAIVKLAAGV